MIRKKKRVCEKEGERKQRARYTYILHASTHACHNRFEPETARCFHEKKKNSDGKSSHDESKSILRQISGGTKPLHCYHLFLGTTFTSGAEQDDADTVRPAHKTLKQKQKTPFFIFKGRGTKKKKNSP